MRIMIPTGTTDATPFGGFTPTTAVRPVRLAFVGAGWIGTHRMRALLERGGVEAAAIVDADTNVARAAATAAGIERTAIMRNLDMLLARSTALELDGVVIATPSALHADQAIAALLNGLAVFVQKPLARTADETRQVVAAARSADRSLGVDFSYRGVAGMTSARRRIANGDLGTVHAIDMAFHNAYGPDKPWFFDRQLAGGGCVMDLGCHLVDMLLWLQRDDPVLAVHARRYANGMLLRAYDETCEDFALATMTLQSGVTARLACSWHAHAGRDAVIEVNVFGTRGGIRLSNRNGSFTDLQVELHEGTRRTLLAPADTPWGGAEIGYWVDRLSRGARFCAESAAHYVAVAEVIDRINAQ
jgi:predicted dehydrogenase